MIGSALHAPLLSQPILAAGGGPEVTFPIIPALIVAPLLGALVIALMPARRADLFRWIGLVAATITGAMSVYMLTAFDSHEAGYQFVTNQSWISDLGISMHFGVDGISLFLVVLTGVIFPIAILGAKITDNQKAYYGWLLVLMAGSMGVFTSLDLVLFFAFFEIVLVPMYFLIGLWGHGNRTYAATKFFLYTMFGSAFMLVGLVALAVLNQKAVGGQLTFDIVEIAQNQAISTEAGRWLFCAFAIAFAVKVPLFPLHTWLPDAHTEAPTAGSVILAGGHVEARHVRLRALRPLHVPGGLEVGRSGHDDPRRHRHHLRRHLRHDAEGPQAPRRLLVDRAPRLHRAGHLLDHGAGRRGRHPDHGQPRHHHRRAVPARRVDLRTPTHAR